MFSGEMRIGRGNRRTGRKFAPILLWQPQIPQRPDLGSKPATNRLSYGLPETLVEVPA
jgi:hypothetical protein